MQPAETPITKAVLCSKSHAYYVMLGADIVTPYVFCSYLTLQEGCIDCDVLFLTLANVAIPCLI